MAVKTQLSEKEFSQILSKYDLGNFVRAEPVSAGTVQTNYFLSTTEGQFVFRYYENRSRESVRFETHLLAYLVSHKFPCPQPYPDVQGERVGEFNRKPFVVFEYLDGATVESQNAAQKHQLIQQVARLQELTRDYQPVFREHRLNYDVETCLKLARGAAQNVNTKDGWRKFAWMENQLSLLDLPESIPKGICHCDFHYANALFRGDDLVGLIDFDDANYTYLVFDLLCLIDWEWPYPAVQLNFDMARSIARQYMQYRLLSTIEREHAFDVHKLGILIDGIWFFERGGPEDFYEKRKIESLNDLGSAQYTEKLFRM